MIRAWRLTKTRNAASAFTGEGARLFGSRWSSPGLPAVFASESLALATLEVLVHLGVETPLAAYTCFEFRIPGRLVEVLDPSSLPANWRASPAPAGLQVIGNRWLTTGRSAVLRVPSALIPGEADFMINPRHPAFAKIRIGPPQDHCFDPRLAARSRRPDR
jgi:RES domain-containing protein